MRHLATPALQVNTVTVLTAQLRQHAPRVSTAHRALPSVMSTLVPPVLTVLQPDLNIVQEMKDALRAPMDTTASSRASKL